MSYFVCNTFFFFFQNFDERMKKENQYEYNGKIKLGQLNTAAIYSDSIKVTSKNFWKNEKKKWFNLIKRKYSVRRMIVDMWIKAVLWWKLPLLKIIVYEILILQETT